MPSSKKKNPSQKAMTYAAWYAITFIALILIAFHRELNIWCASVLSLFSPVLLGLAFAYILNPVFRFFERFIFSRMYPHSLRRTVSLLCTYCSFLLAAAVLVLLIVPQLFFALTSFLTNYQEHVDIALQSINGFLSALNGFFEKTIGRGDFFTPVQEYQFFDKIYALLEGLLETIDLAFITATAGAFFSGVADVIFALFISLYFLISKEKRYAQVMKFRNAVFSDETNKMITRLCSTIDRLFGKFFEGRVIDSLIVGILLYIFFTIFGIPYAIILAAFIAFTNIIPYVGFFIGGVPATLIVLFTDYEKLLPFLIISIIIFQFDNNIISPKILGNNTGISSLCVIIAICVMGAMFGVIGMLIAVPLFATLLDFGNSFIRGRLQKKQLPDDIENYYAPDPFIDPMEMNQGNTKNLLMRIERRSLRAKKLTDAGLESELTWADRISLRTYQAAKKFRIFTDPSPETLAQFSAEESRKGIKKAFETRITEYRATLEEESRGEDAV